MMEKYGSNSHILCQMAKKVFQNWVLQLKGALGEELFLSTMATRNIRIAILVHI